MTVLVPDYNTADVSGMAGIDTVHIQSLQDAHSGKGVRFGCAVTVTSGLELSVAQGTVQTDGSTGAGATETVSLSTGAGITTGQARRDAIVRDAVTGAASVLTGTPSDYDESVGLIPALPALSATQVLLATYWMGEGETTAAAARLVDARTIINDNGMIVVTSPSIGAQPAADFDNTAALAACAEGAYWFPPGRYEIESQINITQTGDLSWQAAPGSVDIVVDVSTGFGTATDTGSMIRHTTSGATATTFTMTGFEFHAYLLPNSATKSWPFNADAVLQWPFKNLGADEVSSVFASFDALIESATIADCAFYMSDRADDNAHWIDSGGDSAFFWDCENTRRLEVTRNRFYGSNDSAVYISQVGTRTVSDYSAKATVHHNYFEGCGNGVHVKGELVGGDVASNAFVNCANPIAVSDGNQGSGTWVNVVGNVIDGYNEAILFQGPNNIAQGNIIFNAGHFDTNGASLSDKNGAATLDDFFDQPKVFSFAIGGTTSDTGSNCKVFGNIVGGVTRSAELGRATAWEGDDPVVFWFSGDTITGNHCHNNWLVGPAADWKYLAQDIGTPSGNVVSWDDPSFIEDHSWTTWLNRTATDAARGPVLEATLSTDETGPTSDTSYTTIDEFDFDMVDEARYRLEGDFFYSTSETGDLKMGFASPGSNVNTGHWTLQGLGTSATSTGGSMHGRTSTVFDSPGGNRGLLGGHATEPLTGRLVGVIDTVGQDGTLNLQYGQLNSDATPAVIHAGSRYVVDRIA